MLQSILARFSLGMVIDRLDAGVLRIHEETVGPVAGQRAGIKYDRTPVGGQTGYFGAWVRIVRDANSETIRQIRTTNVLVDLVDNNEPEEGDYSYQIRFYYAKDTTDPSNPIDCCELHSINAGAKYFRMYEVRYDGGSATLTISDNLRVNDADSTTVLRGSVEYFVESGHLALVRKDGGGTVLRKETLTPWTTNTAGDWRYRDFARYDFSAGGASTLVYSEYEEESKYVYYVSTPPANHEYAVWRRTKRIVDPGGLNLITTWTYSNESVPGPMGYHGVVLQSIVKSDGSWVWYNIGPTADWTGQTPPAGEPWMVQVVFGFKNTPPPSTSPDIDSAGVRSITRIYRRKDTVGSEGARYRLDSVEEKIGTSVVRKWDYDPTSLHKRRDWTSASGATLNTLIPVARDELHHLNHRRYITEKTTPAGVMYVYSGAPVENAHWYIDPPSPSSLAPHVVHAGGSPDPDWIDCRQSWVKTLSVTDGYVVGESTKQERYVDRMGNVWMEERFFATGNDAWQSMGWTCREFDGRGRMLRQWTNDGSHWSYQYNSCCETEMTDPSGVVTTITRDYLGRTTTVVREAGSQPPITQTYSYAGLVESIVTAGGTLTDSQTRTYDKAGRVVSILTGTDTGQLQTLFGYSIRVSNDLPAGWRLKTFRDFGPSDTLSTAEASGRRARYDDYFPDGQIEHTYGSGVIEATYDHGVGSGPDANLRWNSVITGPTTGSSTDHRKTIRYTDMLGRTDHTISRGWAASGSVDQITQYEYASTTGQLTRVIPPTGPATRYAYDSLGHLSTTTFDVDGDAGNIGPKDRITKTEHSLELRGSDVWSVNENSVLGTQGTYVLTGSSARKLTGYTGLVSGEFTQSVSESLDIDGNKTETTVKVDRGTATRKVLTKMPGATHESLNSYDGGRLVEANSATGVKTTYAYDGLGRQVGVTDGRGKTTSTEYDPSGRVIIVRDPANNATTYEYFQPGDADPDANSVANGEGLAYPGRIKWIAPPPLGSENTPKKSYFAYNNRGDTTHTWGNIPYPTQNLFDSYGQRVKLRTFNAPGTWGQATWPATQSGTSETTWTFHPATGILNSKMYADSTTVDYEYADDGKLLKRKWARLHGGQRLETNYAYLSDTQELQSVTYGDDTPSVSYEYDRLGRHVKVTDGAGERTFGYDENKLRATSESFAAEGGSFDGRVITQLYEAGAAGEVLGRWRGIQVGIAGNSTPNYEATYEYDTTHGRLVHVTGPGLPTGGPNQPHGAWYTFAAGASGSTTDLLEETRIKDSSDTILGYARRTYDTNRELIEKVENNFYFGDSTPTLVSSYTYAHDTRARRQGVSYGGAAFTGSGFVDDWAYNDRNELKATDRKAAGATIEVLDGTDGTSSPLDRRYAYDPIGDRNSANEGTNSTDPVYAYQDNNLNQYFDIRRTAQGTISGQGLLYDEDGNLRQSIVAADINGDGVVDAADLALILSLFGSTCDCFIAQPPCNQVEFTRADIDGDCAISLTDLSTLLNYFGTTGDTSLERTFVWDAENRLIATGPTRVFGALSTPQSGDKKIEFRYDYRGRRIEKKVSTHNGTAWSVTSTRRFLWNGWLMVMELSDAGGSGFQPARKYTWGRDIGGGLESAGGIGGLLAVDDANDLNNANDDLRLVCCYDANGNIGQVVDWATTSSSVGMKARYEYDAYGNVIGPDADSDGDWRDDAAPYAITNPYRFSTKPWDDETGLGYWGYRYYEPRMGRWLSRDPIEELGGQNLFAMSKNEPTNLFDALGQAIAIDNHDIVEVWCEPLSYGHHCYSVCRSGRFSQRDDGTGPGVPPGSPLPGSPTPRPSKPPKNNGHPGHGGVSPSGPTPGDVFAGSYVAPRGTCDCISRRGAWINDIPGKEYGYTTSNSNSLICNLLKGCGIKPAAPPVNAPGWCEDVKACYVEAGEPRNSSEADGVPPYNGAGKRCRRVCFSIPIDAGPRMRGDF